MIRNAIFTSTTLAFFLCTGCDKAADEQNKANIAQSEANEKIVSAKVEAEKKMESAQAEADKKIAEAQSGFLKLREDYRHKITLNLAELDRKIETLTAKEKMAVGRGRVDLDARLKQIRTSRAEFDIHYSAIESTASATWDATQSRLEKEWAALKDLVDKT